MYSRLLLLFFVALKLYYAHNHSLKLEQVLILSRHNVRTPLSKNLFEFTPKVWPTWKEKSGYLTAKGAMLEGFMGEYFALWLRQEGLLTDVCPAESEFYVYANNVQRAMVSAESFVNNAFPHCNITIHNAGDSQKDAIFNPVIHNSSRPFKMEALQEMQAFLNSLHLNSSYKDLEGILDYKDSKYCNLNHKCDLVVDKNKLFVNTGFKPNLEGPLKISKSVIDSFIMENYEGFDNVAWGTLQDVDQWNAILDLSRGYHNVIFNTTLVAHDVAKPLLRFINDLFVHRQNKVTLLMGHDSNIYTVLKSMGFKPYILDDQYEMIPAGGKLVFQKWVDVSGKFYVKIDYVYQCTDGMREGRRLSFSNPPEFRTLELAGCKIDVNGLCLWEDFVNLLNDSIKK